MNEAELKNLSDEELLRLFRGAVLCTSNLNGENYSLKRGAPEALALLNLYEAEVLRRMKAVKSVDKTPKSSSI